MKSKLGEMISRYSLTPGADIRSYLGGFAVSDSTINRWLKRGWLDRRGDGLVLTAKAYYGEASERRAHLKY